MNKITDLNIEQYKNLSIKQKKIEYNLIENISTDIEIKFCPSKDCFNILNQSFYLANSEIKCAFYELDEENIAKLLLNKSNKVNVSLIIDDEYLNENSILILKKSNVKIYSDRNRDTKYNNYMHNKFCIIDKKYVITGSMNPTTNDIYKNNNNILKIESKYLAKNYLNEFEQMEKGIYGYNKISTIEYNNITLKYKNETYYVSSYMCPQNNCDEKINNILKSANSQILFATFTLTHDEIEKTLIEKSNQNINIYGIIEKRNYNLMGSNISNLNNYFKIKNDTNKYNMHHKFFIIDEKYVITGSMNPTSNGANYNDENILIIENKNIVNLYKEEFEKITSS